VSELFCIPDAITNALSDIAVYALITAVDQEWSWVEEDGKGAAVQRKASVRGMEHTPDLDVFLRSLCDASNGGTHMEVVLVCVLASKTEAMRNRSQKNARRKQKQSLEKRPV
jgi:hypothetical protein